MKNILFQLLSFLAQVLYARTETVITIINNESYSLYNMTYNTASINNTWNKNPSFISEDLTYSCTRNLGQSSDSIIFSQNEQLSKVVNSLYFTNDVNHYGLDVIVQFWIIDINDPTFEFYMKVDTQTLVYTQDKDGNPFVTEQQEYCYLPFITSVCSDYCGDASYYDSLVQISATIEHTNPTIQLDFSALLTSSTQLIGINSLTITVQTCNDACFTCETTSSKCTSCKDPLQYLKPQTNVCVSTCNEQEYAFTDSGNPLQQLFCLPCSVTKCKICLSNVCSECIDSYYYNSSTNTCEQCSAELNCKTCLSGSECLTCPSGYFLNPTSKVCDLCNATLNCLTCDKADTCLTCKNQLSVDSSGLCTVCPVGCKTCSTSSGDCDTCKEAYYKDSAGTSCLPCSAHCNKCNNNSFCNLCYIPFYNHLTTCIDKCGDNYFQMDGYYACINFETSYCPTPTHLTGCTGQKCCTIGDCRILGQNTIVDKNYASFRNWCKDDCGKGYYMDDHSTIPLGKECFKCQDHCDLCISKTVCTQCSQQYFLKTNADLSVTCKPCISNCLECQNDSSCSLCNEGYVVNNGLCVTTCPSPKFNTGIECKDCNITSCVQCASLSQCDTCTTGLVPVLNKCYKKCSLGTFRDGTNVNCTDCSSNCKNCTSATTCVQCEDGYYLNSQQCNKCDDSCLTCSAGGSSSCSTCSTSVILFQGQCLNECPIGYFLNGSQCENCAVQDCAKCQTSNTCDGCVNLSQLIVESSYCATSCPYQYQQYTNWKGYLACDKIICDPGYWLVNGVCQDKCGDGQTHFSGCDDGNLVSGDGCSSTCTVENGFTCLNSISSPSVCRILITISLLQGESSNQFIIQFSQPLHSLTNQSILLIYVPSVSTNQYSYKMNAVSGSDTKYQVSFTFLVQIPKQTQVTVSVAQETSQGFSVKTQPNLNYVIPAQSSSLTVNTEYEVSQSEQSVSQSVQTVGTVLQSSISTSVIPLVLSGNINFVAGIIDITQLIQLHQYVDVKFPFTLDAFFNIFNGFNFPFVTNFFQFFIPNNLNLSSYDSFSSNGVSALYLSNTGQFYSILLFTMIAHGILKLIGRKYNKINHKVDQIFKYSVYHEVVMSTYLEVTLYTFLQCTNMAADTAIEYINHIIMFVTFIIVFPIPFVAAYLIKKHYHSLENKEIEERFGSLWEGLNPKYICRIYYLFVHIRKFLFSLFIVSLNPAPQAQCILLMLPSFVLLCIVIKTKPFKKRSENIKQIIQESCLMLGQIFLLVLQANTDSLETKRTQISWGIIIFFSVILIMHFICSMVETIQVFAPKMKEYLKKFSQRSKIYDISSFLTRSSLQTNKSNQLRKETAKSDMQITQNLNKLDSNPTGSLKLMENGQDKSILKVIQIPQSSDTTCILSFNNLNQKNSTNDMQAQLAPSCNQAGQNNADYELSTKRNIYDPVQGSSQQLIIIKQDQHELPIKSIQVKSMNQFEPIFQKKLQQQQIQVQKKKNMSNSDIDFTMSEVTTKTQLPLNDNLEKQWTQNKIESTNHIQVESQFVIQEEKEDIQTKDGDGMNHETNKSPNQQLQINAKSKKRLRASKKHLYPRGQISRTSIISLTKEIDASINQSLHEIDHVENILKPS